MKSLIINNPSLQTLRERFSASFITFVFWAVWIYLWLPLLSLLAWLVGINLFYQRMIVESGLKPFFELAGWYILTVLLIAMAVMGWAGYNRFRYGGRKERRRGVHVVEHGDIARQFGVDADKLRVWQREKRLAIHHDEIGEIVQIVDKTTHQYIT